MRPRTSDRPIHLRSARMLDVDHGELVEPGSLLIEGERISEVSPTSVPDDAMVIDLGDVTLLPGLMDMEVNLLLGGPDHSSPLTAVQDDPAVRTLRAVFNARRTLRAGFTTVRNLGLFIQTNGILLDVALKKAIDLDWIEGPRVVPAGHAITPHRRAPRPDDVPGLRPARPAPHGGGGHRQRRGRGPQGRPLPDQARCPAHQGVRLRRRDVPHRSRRSPAVLRRGAGRHRRRSPSSRAQGGRPRPWRRRDPGLPSRPASTASSTAR